MQYAITSYDFLGFPLRNHLSLKIVCLRVQFFWTLIFLFYADNQSIISGKTNYIHKAH